MRHAAGALVPLLLAVAGVCLAEAPERWVPEYCVDDPVGDARSAPTPSELESRWNRAYRRGLASIERGEIHVAQEELCRAAFVARRFAPRDWRFAETLDELGLIAFTLPDFDRAERVQGAAIAEMLLAVGPHGEPFRSRPPSDQAPIRSDCRSGVSIYLTRLGWIHERVPGRISTSELENAPWRIFEAGYLPFDGALAERLDWLVAQYLLEENLAAADALGELQQRIRGAER